MPLPHDPLLIRAANVLRQYDEDQVADVWRRLTARLAPGGLLVEGTCDEIGRRHVWVALGPEGPRTVTFATRLGSLDRPSDLAERLPKALIHRNVPGEPVHAFLRDFDRAWAAAAPYASYGARQRWIRTARALSADWPVLDRPARWRQGEVTVAWGRWLPFADEGASGARGNDLRGSYVRRCGAGACGTDGAGRERIGSCCPALSHSAPAWHHPWASVSY